MLPETVTHGVLQDVGCCSQYIGLVVLGSIFAFTTAFGIGANDVANAFATSVGAKSVTLRQAVMIAAVFEFCGAAFLGAHVANTVRKGIVNVDLFASQPEILLVGMVCAEFATAFWLLFATALGLPVSTTHSIIGGIVGFSLAAYGSAGVNWTKIGLIVASWFLSPALSAVFSCILYGVVRHFVLRAEDSTARALVFYPILVGGTVAINSFYFLYKAGSKGLNTKDLPYWAGVLIAIGIGIVTGVILKFTFVDRYLAPKMNEENFRLNGNGDHVNLDESASTELTVAQPALGKTADLQSAEDVTNSKEKQVGKPSMKKEASMFSIEDQESQMFDLDDETSTMHAGAEVFNEKTEFVFTYLQVFTACVDALGHGANDVANSIGPYASIIAIYTSGKEALSGSKTEIPFWVLAFGGVGIVLGLALLGWKIIESIGVKLMKVTPSRGFSIELGAALVIVTGSTLGLPLSTTHCQVGAETGVGMMEGAKTGVNWPLMSKVFLGWIMTLVVCGALSATLFSLIVYAPSMPNFEGARIGACSANFNVTLYAEAGYNVSGCM